MFDSAGGNIPAGATQILLPTDGIYSAKNAQVKARFPNATYQTYTALGQVPAEWIDTEPGCVWPVSASVALWHRWKGNGITKGFYCSTGVRPQIQALLVAGETPEWFEADPTMNPHIRAGDTETQWGFYGSYDETETPDAPAPVVTPKPAPIGPQTAVNYPGENMTELELNVDTDAHGNGWTDFNLNGSVVVGEPIILDAAPGTPAPQPDGERYDQAAAHLTIGAGFGHQRVEVVNGCPNASYGVKLPVTP